MTNTLKQNILNHLLSLNKDNKISQQSINTYVSYLNKLYSQFNSNSEFEPEFFLTDNQSIIKFVDDNIKNANSKKSYIASILYILRPYNTKNDEFKKNIYLEYINIIAKNINDDKLKQSKNEKEQKNWISQSQLKEIYNDLYNKYSYLLNQKKLTQKEYQLLQNLLILSLYYLNQPRRLKDYCLMKYYYIDKKIDNYIDYKNKHFVFNNFKTSKFYENNKVNINNDLYDMLIKFIKIKKENKFNDSYLLENEKGDKLSNTNLNQRLNIILGKNISVNNLRKSFLTDIYENIPSLEFINSISNNLGNSFNEQLKTYVKK